jgi:hypothetical protein
MTYQEFKDLIPNDISILDKRIRYNKNGHKVEYIEKKWNSNESEPEFRALDLILEKIWPNITLLQYKKLSREIITHEENYEDDTDLKFYLDLIDLEDLYNYLEKNIIERLVSLFV